MKRLIAIAAFALIPAVAQAQNIRIIGDCLAVGVAGTNAMKARGAVSRAKVGVSSAVVAGYAVPGAYNTIVSTGSNDSNMTVLRKNAEIIQARLGASRITWIVPAKANRAAVIMAVAAAHGDRIVRFVPGRDGIHPKSYNTVAKAILK